MSGRILWRDSFGTWPSLRATFELMPWHWGISWYRDDEDPWALWRLELGPLQIEGLLNRPFFGLERASVSAGEEQTR